MRRRILGAWPGMMKSAWKLFDTQVKSGAMGWAADIAARPPVLDSTGLPAAMPARACASWADGGVAIYRASTSGEAAASS